jgi:HD-like signal output (HDOD) protein
MASINGLPPLPRTYAALSAELARDNWEVNDIVRVVERDPGLISNAFRLANSSALARRRTVTNVKEAVMWIGTNMLKNVILAAEALPSFARGQVPRSLFEDIEKHATLCGAVASRLVDDKFMSENAFLAAALHDTGQMVLALKDPDRYLAILGEARKSRLSLETLEQAAFGMSHSAVGAFLLGTWGLPYPVAEAVAWHHRPSQVRTKRIDVIGAVHIADVLVDEHYGRADAVFDEAYLDMIDGRRHLDRWRKLVADVASGRG